MSACSVRVQVCGRLVIEIAGGRRETALPGRQGRLGATELATAERAGRELATVAPFRESGFRLLMQALAARGNSAKALLVYDQLVLDDALLDAALLASALLDPPRSILHWASIGAACRCASLP